VVVCATTSSGSIVKVAEGSFAVDEAGVKIILAELRKVPFGARRAERGVAIQRIEHTSVLAALGLAEGDELRSVNGYGFDNLVDAYVALRSTMRLEIGGTRNGKPLDLVIRVR
jgi:hypothetical protein